MTHPLLSPEVADQHRRDLYDDADAHRRAHVLADSPQWPPQLAGTRLRVVGWLTGLTHLPAVVHLPHRR